jgi:hypothetical protein
VLLRQNKNLFYRHDESNEPVNERPLSFVPFVLFESPFTSVSASVVDPDPPDPHGSDSFGNLDPHVDPHPHQIKIWIRIRIKVISWIRIRISLQMTSQNVWNMSLFEHFFQEIEHLFGSYIWIRIRVKSLIRIRIK